MQLVNGEWDYVVIGAGSAGCVVANRLSADPRSRVLLVEAGGSDKSIFIQMPAATYLKGIGNPRFDWMYKTEPDPTVKGRADIWPRGKVMGGSSSINGMLYIRGFASDYNAWAEAGAEGWAWKDVLPLFMKHENNERGASDYHGIGGELAVSDLQTPHPIADAFIKAAQACGHSYLSDLNAGDQLGFGYVQATQSKGWRCSAAKAFIDPVRNRPNLTVAKKTQALRILFEDKKATGVELFANSTRTNVRVNREVIVCAGAIASPQLLLHSGVGPATQLRSLGISVVSDSPDVGANLQDHPGLGMTYDVAIPTYNDEMQLWKQLLHGANWLFRGRGAGTTPDAHLIGFLKSANEEPIPDIQVHVTPAGYLIAGEGELVLPQSSFTTVVSVCRPKSRGRISLNSPNPLVAPRIENRIFQYSDDLDRLALGIRAVHKIIKAAPLADIVEGPIEPKWLAPPQEILMDYLQTNAGSIYHPAGTCRMGSDPHSVVDSRLRVRGVSGVRVADASIMPNVVSGNLNAPCMMIGEKASSLVINEN